MRRRKINPSKKWLEEQYLIKEKSTVKIARKLNVNPKTIYTWLKKYNIPIRTISEATKKYANNLNKDILKKFYLEEGKTSLEIASILGCADRTVRKYISKYNLNKTPAEAQQSKLLFLTKSKIKKTYVKNNFILKNTARELEISTSCLRSLFKKLKITKPKREKTNKEVKRYLRDCIKSIGWKKLILERDNYTCQECGQIGGILNIDHKKPFSLILKENIILTIEQGLQCEELWDINNGRVLCLKCHKQTETFGNKRR